ncbi:hypothetical protein [Arthrobacter sp. YN]|uniref:hypothetical protein n=1 Tax=Arthrobacter sp. YN TaxID=2020486 RepID=UPI000B5E745F|nr:hypothetical protein [Arthrobacter sp. YN]ASN21321.1 hypothetical protein CGK93_17745 [Arthrobacter sp. YN]
MKGTRAFPRATNILRSVVIAGAGTALWMALSATAASADTGADENYSLPGGVTSAVSSVEKATAHQSSAPPVSVPVPNVTLPAPVKAVVPAQPISVPVPAVTPLVAHVGEAVGGNVGTVVEAVAVPVTETADRAVAGVVPPVTDVTNPIVQPIIDVVDEVLQPVGSVLPPVLPTVPGGVGSLPPAAPSGDPTPGVGTLPSSGVVSSQPGAAATENDVEVPAAAGTVPATRAIASGSATVALPVLSIARVLGSANSVQAVGTGSAQEPTEPADLPAGLGSVPAGLAGNGSGNSQNGPPSPAAAFLHGALIVPADSLTDLETVSDEQHPKPVSFDPGSSPD